MSACQAHAGRTARRDNRCAEPATLVVVSTIPPFSSPVPLTVHACDRHAAMLLSEGWNVLVGATPDNSEAAAYDRGYEAGYRSGREDQRDGFDALGVDDEEEE